MIKYFKDNEPFTTANVVGEYRVTAFEYGYAKEIICDVCGNSQSKPSSDTIMQADAEYGILYGVFGFDSQRDGDEVSLHICEGCFEKVENFVRSLGASYKIHNSIDNTTLTIKDGVALGQAIKNPVAGGPRRQSP